MEYKNLNTIKKNDTLNSTTTTAVKIPTPSSNLNLQLDVNITQNAEKPDVKPKKKIIVVSAFYRSGSTLMGTLFDRNPNLVYYFEPLSHFKLLPEEQAQVLEPKLNMLAEMFSCKPPDSRRYAKYANDRGGTKRWLHDGISQYYASHRFCSPPFCNAGPFPEKVSAKYCSSFQKQIFF